MQGPVKLCRDHIGVIQEHVGIIQGLYNDVIRRLENHIAKENTSIKTEIETAFT